MSHITCPRCGRAIWNSRYLGTERPFIPRHKVTPPAQYKGPYGGNPWCNRIPPTELSKIDNGALSTNKPAAGSMWEWRYRDKRGWHDWQSVAEGTGTSLLAFPAWEVEFRPRPIRRFLAYNTYGTSLTVEAYDKDFVPAMVHSLGDLKGIVEL